MKPNHKQQAAAMVRRGRLALMRFALREAASLLCASAPLVFRGGEKLRALSEHPALATPPDR